MKKIKNAKNRRFVLIASALAVVIAIVLLMFFRNERVIYNISLIVLSFGGLALLLSLIFSIYDYLCSASYNEYFLIKNVPDINDEDVEKVKDIAQQASQKIGDGIKKTGKSAHSKLEEIKNKRKQKEEGNNWWLIL